MPRKLTALIVCGVSYIFSCLFCFSWGFTYFDVADRYIAVYLLFLLGIAECFGAAWMFGFSELMEREENNQRSITLLLISYWGGLAIMGPVTIFMMGENNYIPYSPIWGVIFFWVILIMSWVVSFILMKKRNIKEWYSNVLFYGAYQLAVECVKRSDETLSGDSYWWSSLFIGWWSFSIKYFVPFAVWHLMLWNFKQDLTPDVNGRYYGGYNIFW